MIWEALSRRGSLIKPRLRCKRMFLPDPCLWSCSQKAEMRRGRAGGSTTLSQFPGTRHHRPEICLHTSSLGSSLHFGKLVS
jgi:hypothetical protein